MKFFEPFIGIFKAVLLFAAVLALLWVGARIERAGWLAKEVKKEAKAEETRVAQQTVINEIDVESVAKKQKQAPINRIITEQVKVYVPTTLDLLPGGFRLQHDSAATGKTIDDSSATTAAPVAPETVASTITENYESHRAIADDLEEMQQIARESGCFLIAAPEQN